MKSGVKVTGSTLIGALTASTGIVASSGINMVVNKVIDGDYKESESIKHNILGIAIDNYLGNKSNIAPFLREGSIKVIDYMEGKLKEDEK